MLLYYWRCYAGPPVRPGQAWPGEANKGPIEGLNKGHVSTRLGSPQLARRCAQRYATARREANATARINSRLQIYVYHAYVQASK